jgi:serine phosphatase RsbU (regulator of sigma subunit)
MQRQVSQGDELQAALLNSDWVRTRYVLGAVAILAAVYLIRLQLFDVPVVGAAVILALLCLAAVEIAAYSIAKRASRLNKTVPTIVSIGIILAETSVPALYIALFTTPEVPIDFRALANPWVLILCLIILSSTLRLSPWLSRFAGFISGIFYLAAAFHHGWRPALLDPAFYTVTRTGVLFYALILLILGWAAGAVAGQIRKHVEAALSAAEARQQLKQVQHDLDVARSIQQSLLPASAPHLSGFQIAGWNLPADATGGDFFDWQHLGHEKFAVMLADVTGHGIGPALLAAVCRAYARASFNAGEALGETVQQVNRLLAADLTPPHYATFVAAVCNLDDLSIELFSAGHGPIFSFSVSSDSFKEVDSQSVPLGLLPEIERAAPAVLQLQCGDMLFLLTDGFVEWENSEGEEFGLERAMNTVRRLHYLSPQQMIRELYRAVLVFADGTKQKDDLTAVVIKRIPVATATGDQELELPPKEESVTLV